MWCRRKVLKITGTLLEIVNYQICGLISQDSLHWVTSPRMNVHGPWGDWRENKRPQDPANYGQKCGNLCLTHQNGKRCKKCAVEKPQFDNAWRLRGIYFIDPKDEEFKDIMKNARRKLDIPMPAAMPCQTSLCRSSRETCRTVGGQKTRYACIVEADESTRKRMEGAHHKNDEDHIAGKGMKFIESLQSSAQTCSYASSNENTRCKGSSGKRIGKTRENTGMAADEGQKQKWGERWSKEWGQKSAFCVINGSPSSQDFGVGTAISKIERTICTSRRHWERWFWIVCSIYWAMSISITNDGCNSDGYHVETTRMRRTSSWCNIWLHPGQNGRCTDVTENSKVRMSRYLDTSTKAQMAKIMVQYGRSSRSSWTKSVRSSFGRTVMGKAIREHSIKIRLGKGSKLGMLIREPRKGQFLFVCVDDINLAGKKQNINPTWKILMEKRWFGRTDTIPCPCLFGLHSKRMSNKQGYCRQLQKYVRVQDFWRIYGKTTSFREIGCEYFFMVLRHGRSRSEVRGRILPTGEQNNATIIQSRNTMPRRPPIQRSRSGIWDLLNLVQCNLFFWGQWSRDQDKIKGRSPTKGTRVKNPQGCSGLVAW